MSDESNYLVFTPDDLQSMLLNYWMAEPPTSLAQGRAVLQVIIDEARVKQQIAIRQLVG